MLRRTLTYALAVSLLTGGALVVSQGRWFDPPAQALGTRPAAADPSCPADAAGAAAGQDCPYLQHHGKTASPHSQV